MTGVSSYYLSRMISSLRPRLRTSFSKLLNDVATRSQTELTFLRV